MSQAISGPSPSTPNNPENPTTDRQLKPSTTATHIIRALTEHTS